MTRAIPWYAVDLLMAAKFVSWPPKGSTPEMLAEGIEQLLAAVIEFEKSMPVIDGAIIEER
jgi:hypothetical protein